MHRSPLVRSRLTHSFLTLAAIVAAGVLAGCKTDGTDFSARALAPIPPKLLAEMEQKNMAKDSPILIRLFKEESELEVWKQDRTGQFALLKTYPICRWSGELGPKLREGDRQAPEGFYNITPAQMNPKSQYYLAFNLGFPNAYDRAWGRTGSELMIHGDCSSRGCYAMTDEQITEIYALGREAFFGGQRAFQVQAYPFRMTPANLAKHRNNPNMPFWKMLKVGNDHFEVTRSEPKVDVCEKRYVFNAQPPANASGPLAFNPTGKCPAFEIPNDIVAAVHEKQRRDEFQTAELITRGAKTAPVKTGLDGGMHQVFLAALQKQDSGPSDRPLLSLDAVSTPGTVPKHAVPPDAPRPLSTPQPVRSASPVGTSTSRPAQALAAAERPAASAPQRRAAVGSLFSSLYTSRDEAQNAAAPSTETTATVNGAAKSAASQPAQSAPPPPPAGAIRPRPAAADKTAEHSAAAIVPGAASLLPAGSFESRWLALGTSAGFSR